jgi:hypothetical protein
VGLVIVFVLGACASNVSEGGVGSEYDQGIVDGSEVGELGAFEVIIGLEVEGVVAVEGLPFVCDLIECFGSKIGLDAVVLAGWFEGGLDVLDGSLDGILNSLESV